MDLLLGSFSIIDKPTLTEECSMNHVSKQSLVYLIFSMLSKIKTKSQKHPRRLFRLVHSSGDLKLRVTVLKLRKKFNKNKVLHG